MIVESGTEAPAKSAMPGVYSAQDAEACKQIIKWLADYRQSRAWLARKCRVSNALVSNVLNGRYAASPASYLQTMLEVIRVESERLGDGTPGYIKGSVHKLATLVCDRTRKSAGFGVLCGAVGTGKTRALKEYRRERPQTLLIEANPSMTSASLLNELLGALSIALAPGNDRKFDHVTKALMGTSYLIIVDEAELLSANALHYLRRVRDKAGVGVVLAGTERLQLMLKPEHGQFDQVRSRVNIWPRTITAITRDDADEIVRATLAMHDVTEVPDDVLDSLWEYCAGSARVLTESLLPAIRDYGLGRHELSVKLVDALAQQVLFIAQRRNVGAAA